MTKIFTAVALFLSSLFWPQTVYPYPHRGVLLDCARKYYSVDWIKNLIDEMAARSANELILHFSENEGLRIESEQFPWLTEPLKEEVYSHKDILDIGAYAQKRGICLIPSFDSPGHLQFVLDAYEAHYSRSISVKGAPACLDVADEEGVSFIRSLQKEYGELFLAAGSKEFDMGGDEVFSKDHWDEQDEWAAMAQEVLDPVPARPYDAFVLYMNDTNAFLKSMGYGCRMYNDQLQSSNVKLDEDITIEYWIVKGTLPPDNRVLNYLNFYLYYILDPNLHYLGVTPAAIEREWTPGYFLNEKIDRERVEGSCFCIWADIPESQSEKEVLNGVLPLLDAWSKKCGAFSDTAQ